VCGQTATARLKPNFQSGYSGTFKAPILLPRQLRLVLGDGDTNSPTTDQSRGLPSKGQRNQGDCLALPVFGDPRRAVTACRSVRSDGHGRRETERGDPDRVLIVTAATEAIIPPRRRGGPEISKSAPCRARSRGLGWWRSRRGCAQDLLADAFQRPGLRQQKQTVDCDRSIYQRDKRRRFRIGQFELHAETYRHHISRPAIASTQSPSATHIPKRISSRRVGSAAICSMTNSRSLRRKGPASNRGGRAGHRNSCSPSGIREVCQNMVAQPFT
jgi:hypothetical protein